MDGYPVRKEHHLKDYDYATPGYYFVTICAKARNHNVFSRVESVGGGLCAAPSSVCLTGIGREVEAAIQKISLLNPGVSVDCYTIMPDHVHLIVVLETGRDGARPLQDIVGRMKSYTARCYRGLGAPFGHPLWQSGYYDHIIRNDTDLRETRQYIQDNPTKWTLDRTDTDG